MGMAFGLLFFVAFCAVGIGFLVFGIKLAFGVFDLLCAASRRSLQRMFPPPAPISKTIENTSTVPAIAWSLLPSTIVLGIFVGLSGAANREWQKFVLIVPPPPQPVVVQPAGSADTQNVSFHKTLDQKPDSLPEWIKKGDLIEGDVHQFVLSSRLWSTEAEAVLDVKNQAIERIRSDFLQRHPGFLDPKKFDIDGIVKTMVKQNFIEKIEQDFGKFTAPMYRAWWQAEISPIVRTELYPQWKSASIQNRIIVVGIILALLTLVGNSVELLGSLQSDARASTAKILAFGTVPLAYSAMELLVAAQLMS